MLEDSLPDLRPLWNTEQCARYLGVSIDWLNGSRCRGDGPPFIKIGRNVRYLPAQVEEWLRDRVMQSTSERSTP